MFSLYIVSFFGKFCFRKRILGETKWKKYYIHTLRCFWIFNIWIRVWNLVCCPCQTLKLSKIQLPGIFLIAFKKTCTNAQIKLISFTNIFKLINKILAVIKPSPARNNEPNVNNKKATTIFEGKHQETNCNCNYYERKNYPLCWSKLSSRENYNQPTSWHTFCCWLLVKKNCTFCDNRNFLKRDCSMRHRNYRTRRIVLRFHFT